MKNLILALLLGLSLQSQAQYRGYILCSIDNPKVSCYINHIWDDCQYISKEYNLPLSLILAQCCLESGFGTSRLAKQNNHLGIKLQGQYATFTSLRECLSIYANTLTNECYRSLQPQSLLEWIDSLRWECCSYAKSPEYSKKLIRIIEKYNLDVIPVNNHYKTVNN